MMGTAVDDLLQCSRNTVVPIMNGDRPDVDKDIEAQIGHLVQWEKERIKVVRDTLEEAVQGVESMACKRRRNLP